MDEQRGSRRSGGAPRKAAGQDCCPGRPGSPRIAPARPDVRSQAATFKALADETRLRVLALLAEARSELCACDIEACFSLSQPTISHHMKVLREAGLVTAEKRGLWVYYALRPEGFSALKQVLDLSR